MAEILFEEKWFNAKTKSVSELVSFIKKTPVVLKKYKFEKIQSDIITKLLKSNDHFWSEIEGGTEQSRKIRTVINNIEERINHITNRVIEEVGKDEPNSDMILGLKNELRYYEENFDPETSILITYEDVNKDYEDIELIFFFVEYAEAISTLIDNTVINENTLVSKDVFFIEYLTQLFAYHINGILIEVKEKEIVLKPVVDELDVDAVNELNE